MLPGDGSISAFGSSPFLSQVCRRTVPLVDYELGGVALGDTSQGLSTQLWTLRVVGEDFVLSAPSVPDVAVYSYPGVTLASLAFDGSMAPVLAWSTSTESFIRFPSGSSFTVLSLGSILQPRLTLDDHRTEFSAGADVVLAYVRAGKLYNRLQREDYSTEHLLLSGVSQLIAIGMSRGNRLQFRYI